MTAAHDQAPSLGMTTVPVQLTIDHQPVRVWITQAELDTLDALPPYSGSRTITTIRMRLAGPHDSEVNLPASRIAPRR